MKLTTRFYAVTAFFVTGFSFAAMAQQVESKNESAPMCRDQGVHRELVAVNDGFQQQGFKLHLFRMVELPAKTYVPVAVTLEQGKMYQINLIATHNFQHVRMALIDKDKNELIRLNEKPDDSGKHFFSKSFAAPYSGVYWIVLSQKVKGEAVTCGGLSILEAAH